jgi:hypothetical protein
MSPYTLSLTLLLPCCIGRLCQKTKTCQTREMLKYIANVNAAEISGVRRKLRHIKYDGC